MSRKLLWTVGIAMLALVACAVVFILNSKRNGEGNDAPPRTETVGKTARELGIVEIAGGIVALGEEAAKTTDRIPARTPAKTTNQDTISETTKAVKEIGVHGLIIVSDKNGNEYAAESGTLTLLKMFGTMGFQETLPVKDGKWDAASIIHREIRVDEIVLGGKVAFVEIDELEQIIPDRGVITIRAKWPAPEVLRVVDQSTKLDLTGIQILMDRSGVIGEKKHPGDPSAQTLLVNNGASPIEILPKIGLDSTSELWIRAAGYAWKKVTINFRTTGERVVTLARPAALEINIQPNAPKNTFVRIFEMERVDITHWPGWDGEPYCEFRCDDKSVLQLENLDPGNVRVVVSAGAWYQDHEDLAETRVNLVAYERTRVFLQIKELAKAPDPVPFRGTLLVPADWQGVKLDLNIHESGTRTRRFKKTSIPNVKLIKKSPGVYEWDAGMIELGKHSVEVKPLHTYIAFDIPQAGLTDAMIQLREATKMQIRLVDINTGEDVKEATLSWVGAKPEGMDGWSRKSIVSDVRTLQFNFRVPAGTASLYFEAPGYRSESQTVSLSPGLYVNSFTMRKATGVRVIFKDGDDIVPSDNFYCNIEAIGHNGRAIGFSGGDWLSACEYCVSEPGRYRIVIPKIKGYEEVKPFEFDIQNEKIVDVIVQLKRTK
ncbi:MAG: hypothetical protein ACKVS6_05895 [Planctomycetota bacterium]